MNIRDLFNNRNTDVRQSVVIHFYYGISSLEPLHALESKLRITLFNTGLGELDGHEIAMDSSDGFLYLYGSNAEALFKAIRPLLLVTPFMRNAEVNLRFGAIDFILE
jgi:hypothetical protein